VEATKMLKNSRSASDMPPGCQKAAIALILLIGISQVAGGLGALVWATKTIAPPLVWQDVAISTLLATLFGSFGFAILTVIALARARSANASAGAATNDDPWLARSDWASGQIGPSGGATIAGPILAVVALWWTTAILPLVSVLPSLPRQADSSLVWLTLLFPVAALALYAAFGVQFARARKFGVSIFEMASVPGVVGGQLGGIVHIPAVVDAADGYRVRLACLEWQRRGKDDSHEVAIWQDEQLVTKTLAGGGPHETLLPVLFAIPYEAVESPRRNSKRDVRWLLDVSAALTGADYQARFEVPVYKTPESRRDFRLDDRLVADFAAPPSRELPLRDAGIRREPLPDGVRLVFPAARNWPSALFVTLFVIVFGGLAIYLAPPVWAQILNNFRVRDLMHFLAVGLILPMLATLFLWVALDLWLYRSVVEATTAGLSVRGGLFGLGRTRRYQTAEIRRLTSKESMSSGANVWKSVVVVPRQGKQRTLAKNVAGKPAVEAVIAELQAALRAR
jgi:hypothetical protein